VFNAVLHDTEVETNTATYAATAPTAAAAASVALLVLAKLVSPGKGFGTVVTLQQIEQIITFFFQLKGRYRRYRLDWVKSGMVGQTFLSIRFADGKMIFKCCLYFLVLI
jgi:hypothetical protein